MTMVEVPTQIAKFAYEDDFYTANQGSIVFFIEGLRQHPDLWDEVVSAHLKYKEREAADKKAEVERIETLLDELIDAQRRAAAEHSAAENSHFRSMQAHRESENVLHRKHNEARSIVFGIKNRVGFRKRSEELADAELVEKANKAIEPAQHAETEALNTLRYHIGYVNDANSELVNATKAVLACKQKLDRLRGTKNDNKYRQDGLAND
jgi:hypothetical protein